MGATAPPLPQSSSPLDGPPPSPQSVGAGPTGAPTEFSLNALAPPVPSAQMPPEILTGILQSAEPIKTVLMSWAQAAPDIAVDVQLLIEQMATVLAKLVTAGAQPTSPTATGPAFPAAFDRGISGAGSV